MACKALAVLLLVMAAFACSCASGGDTPSASGPGNGEISFIALVRWVPLEGGFFGLVSEDGGKYLPTNLPEGFREDGLRVKVRGQVKEAFTIYMWGKPFEIHEIEAYGR